MVWVGSQRMLYPDWYEYPREPRTDPQRALGLAFEDVAFPAADGSKLRGWWIPGAPGATGGVVMVHGAGGDRTHLLNEASLLHQSGYPALLFDLREHGVSGGAARGLGLGHREGEDVSSAVAWVRRGRGLCRVAVFGSSQGGAAVLLAAAADPSIDAVIAETAWARLESIMDHHRPPWLPKLLTDSMRVLTLWRLGFADAPEPVEVVAQIAPRPLLLIHGSQDLLVPPSESRALRAAAGDTAQLWIAEGAGHSDSYESQPERFRERMLGFLASGLPAGCPARSG